MFRDDGTVIWTRREPWRDGTRAFVLYPRTKRDCG